MAGEWNEEEARRHMGQAVAALVAEKPAAGEIKPKMGRPEIPSDQWKDTILEAIANGELLSEICDRPGWPSRTTVYRWMAADEDFRRLYRTCAREMGAEAIAEKALMDARKAEDAARGTLAWRAATWHISKMNARRYGDKLAIREDDAPPSEMTDEELLAIATGRSGGTASPEDGEA